MIYSCCYFNSVVITIAKSQCGHHIILAVKMHHDSANSAQKTDARPLLSASICLVDGKVPVQPAAAVARKSNEEQWPLSTVSRGNHNVVSTHE